MKLLNCTVTWILEYGNLLYTCGRSRENCLNCSLSSSNISARNLCWIKILLLVLTSLSIFLKIIFVIMLFFSKWLYRSTDFTYRIVLSCNFRLNSLRTIMKFTAKANFQSQSMFNHRQWLKVFLLSKTSVWALSSKYHFW